MNLPLHNENLVWLDMEMSGLEIEFRRPLEIAVVVTDPLLERQTKTLSIVIHQPDHVLGAMDSFNIDLHVPSGLYDESRASKVSEEQAEKEVLDFIKRYVPKGKSPLCGNVVKQDRLFLEKYFPELNGYLTYHSVDVDTLFQTLKRRNETYVRKFSRQHVHRAGPDVEEAIEMMRYLERAPRHR